MSAYLKFFELEQSPFEGKAQSQVVLGTRALRDAFATIQTGLEEGASRICVNGGPGLGKTSLARALPKLLGDSARVALVLDPTVTWESLRTTLAKQWGIASGRLARTDLIEASRERQIVLVIDQAEKASEEFLDHLDIVLSYYSEDDEPVVQSVLLARLSGGGNVQPAPLIWWLDRIQTLQLEFAPLPREGVESYIRKHLKRAGWTGERLFSPEAALAIHGYTGGIPGKISRLCEKLLVEASQQQLGEIDELLVHTFCAPPTVTEVEPTQGENGEGSWTPSDQFEELAMESEFAEAGDDETESLKPLVPSLAAAFEHFEREAAEPVDDFGEPSEDVPERLAGEPETGFDPDPDLGAAEAGETDPGADDDFADDESSGGLAAEMDAATIPEWGDSVEDDFLDGPATAEELRAIRGYLVGRNLRTFAGAAIAAVVGGILFAIFTGEPDPQPSRAPAASPAPMASRPDASTRTPATAPRSIARATPQDLPDPIPVQASKDLPDPIPVQASKPVEAEPIALMGPGGSFVTVESAERGEVPARRTPLAEAPAPATPPIGIPLADASRAGRRGSEQSPEPEPGTAAPDVPAPEPRTGLPAAPAPDPERVQDGAEAERFW